MYVSKLAAERVRRALEQGETESKAEDEFVRKLASRKVSGRRIGTKLNNMGIKRPVVASRKIRTKSSLSDGMAITPAKEKTFFNTIVKFFSGFTDIYTSRRKPGLDKIVQELENNPQDVEAYSKLFTKPELWEIQPLVELNILTESNQNIAFEPQCLLGIGGQGCVFIGTIGDQQYAFKVRQRSKVVMRAGTSSSPGRRKSPTFRKSLSNGEIEEEVEENESGEKDFLNDTQQEALHREAVGMFRVNAISDMYPKPLVYGYTKGLEYEVLVMEVSDFTLHDVIRGTTWKTRMDILPVIWTHLLNGVVKCAASEVVHHDIKPENIGIKVNKNSVNVGFLDYGIARKEGFRYSSLYRSGKLIRNPGTIPFMSPRSHVWKTSSWIDDYLSLFFTMYNYSTTEGKTDYSNLSPKPIRKFKSPPTNEERASMTPEELVVYCLKYPPWIRISSSINSKPSISKKRINDLVIKEEVSIGMLKIHSITSPKTTDDIISIILNLDGYLDDTIELSNRVREDYLSAAASFLKLILTKHLTKFCTWWCGFAKTTNSILEKETKQETHFETVKNIITSSLEKPEEYLSLIDESSGGKSILETEHFTFENYKILILK